MSPDNHICTTIYELFAQTLLGDIVRRLVFRSPMNRNYVHVSVSFIFLQRSTIPRKKSPGGNRKIKALESYFNSANDSLIGIIFFKVGTVSYMPNIIQSILLELLDRLEMRLRATIETMIISQVYQGKS